MSSALFIDLSRILNISCDRFSTLTWPLLRSWSISATQSYLLHGHNDEKEPLYKEVRCTLLMLNLHSWQRLTIPIYNATKSAAYSPDQTHEWRREDNLQGEQSGRGCTVRTWITSFGFTLQTIYSYSVSWNSTITFLGFIPPPATFSLIPVSFGTEWIYILPLSRRETRELAPHLHTHLASSSQVFGLDALFLKLHIPNIYLC